MITVLEADTLRYVDSSGSAWEASARAIAVDEIESLTHAAIVNLARSPIYRKGDITLGPGAGGWFEDDQSW